MVVTPTASGKTLCYNLPVLDRILKDPDARALYLFPTKALAQDQLAELYAMIEALGADIGTFTYDGDTPQDARKAIRARAHVVVTNPDMLHKGILPHHTKWVKLLREPALRDRGRAAQPTAASTARTSPTSSGACAGSAGSTAREPQFLCSSATIGNPKELAEALTGREMTLIDESGAPARREVLRDLQPAGREPAARHPQVGPRLGPRRRPVVPGQGAADDRLRALAPRHRGAGHVPEGGARDEAGLRGRHPRLPRRLPAAEAARDRARPARGLGPRRRLHERARAGDRHRQPRRGRAPRLSGQRGLGLAAGGTRRAAAGHVGRGAGRQLDARSTSSSPRTPTTSSTRPWSRAASTPTTCRSWSTTSSARPSSCPSTADERFGKEEPGRDPGVPRGGEARCTARASAGTGRARATRPTRSACAASPPTTSWCRTSRASRASSPRWTSTRAPSMVHEKAIYILEGRTYFVEKYDHEERRVHVREAEVDYYTDAITYTKVQILDRFAEEPRGQRPAQPRRGARHLAGGGLQEDQVLHERERRLGRAADARERDAHHRLLAHRAARGDGDAALRAARSGGTGWWRSPTPWARWPRSS